MLFYNISQHRLKKLPQMTTEADYYIKNPKQIVSKLKLLTTHNCLLSAHFGDKDESFITTIIDIDADNKRVYLDYGPAEYLNKGLLTADTFEFRTEINGVKAAFSGLKIVRSKLKGQTVFALTLPESIFWRERRRSYRVKVPRFHDSFIAIPLLIRQDDAETESRVFHFKLYDLSICGCAFLNDKKDFVSQFVSNTTLENCQLYLQGIALENIHITCRNTSILEDKKTEFSQRIGCSFDNIRVGYESSIQRYMQDIEREQANIRH